MISESLPYWPIVPALSPSPWYTFQLDLVRCLWAVLPPACLWGASFPLALAAVASRGQDPGRLVGGVYAANTIGAIAGALVFSLLLVPAIGTAGAERVLIGLAAAAALVVLLPLLRPARVTMRLGGGAALAAAMGVAGWLAWSVTPVPWVVVAFGRQTASLLAGSAPGIVKEVPDGPGDPDVFCTYVGEGTNVSVAVTRRGRACGASTAPARSRRRPSPPTCGSSACWGTSRRSCTRSPSRCWSWPAARASPPAPSSCTPTSSASSSATSSRWCRPS